MNPRSLSQVHAAAGLLAFCLIGSFFVGSLVSELSGNLAWIVAIKRTVFYSMWAMVVLVPVAKRQPQAEGRSSRTTKTTMVLVTGCNHDVSFSRYLIITD